MKQLPDIEAKKEGFTLASECKFSYYFLKRDKKSHPWKCIAFVYVGGDCCQAVATDYFEKYGFKSNNYSLEKVVNERTWIQLQATQHLKQLKFKAAFH